MQTAELGTDYGRQNPWWETGDVSSSARYHSERRSDYQYKLGNVRSSRFTTIAGAAGSGKTTILHQIAHDLIEDDGVPSQNVMYLPLGNPRFQIGSNIIRDAVDIFATYYWRREVDHGEGYVLIDDAHTSDSWDEQVRWCLEEFNDLTVAVTLPTLNRAQTGTIEDLGVETESDLLLPPKFYDVTTESGWAQAEKKRARKLRDALETGADSGDLEPLRSSVDELTSSLESTSAVKRGVLDYFRGAEREVDTTDVAHNLESTIYRDIPRYQQFEDRSDLYALCAFAALNTGRTLGLKDLSGVLECDRRTLQRYLDILEDFFILTPSYQYEYERRRSVRLYLRDPLVVGSLADLDFDGMLESDAERLLMSTVVFDHLKRLGFYYQRRNAQVQFWESAGEAVDFVVETGDGNPLPVVTQDASQDRDPVRSIQTFCDDHNCEFGVVVARDLEPAIDEKVAKLPLWLLLLAI
jgi:predicted AAA+ superfamily ATPase